MDKRAVTRSAAVAIGAQGITTVVSALSVLVLAGRLGELQYGLWQFFLLISSYSGLFHLGLCDGIYLTCGGMNYGELDFSRLGTLLRGMTIFQMILAGVISAASTFFLGGTPKLWGVILALIYMPVFNAHAYLGCIAQATGHCIRYSASVMIDRGCFASGVIGAALAGAADFRIYAGLCIGAKLISALYLAVRCRDIVMAPHCRVAGLRNELAPGSKLLVANLAGQLTTGAPRWAILWQLGEAELGRVSLLITLSGMLTQLSAQLTMVLFPALRRETSKQLDVILNRIGTAARLFLPGLLLLMWPMRLAVSIILPRYASVSYLLAILLPAAVLDARTQLVGITELKVVRHERWLMRSELASGIISLGVCFAAAAFSHECISILICAASVSAVRCVFTEIICQKASGRPPLREGSVFCVTEFAVLCMIFIPLSLTVPPISGFVAFAALYIMYIFTHRRELTLLRAMQR
ncbi:MAG: hypothetical protein PUJ09_07215 [Eubacteriales bacterium]|nr:hypothetical protein [Eubacteriales bacterium]